MSDLTHFSRLLSCSFSHSLVLSRSRFDLYLHYTLALLSASLDNSPFYINMLFDVLLLFPSVPLYEARTVFIVLAQQRAKPDWLVRLSGQIRVGSP